MSVFTVVTPDELSAWLRNYSIGAPAQLEGIAAGIENTNYFVTTTQGRYVLTLFEKLKRHELPFYINLMAHLARHGIPCPQPIAGLDNQCLGELNGKPACIVTCVPGADLETVDAGHCARIGQLLAQMHLAGQSYAATMPNPRGPRWWTAAMPQVAPFLDARSAALLAAEVRFQSAHRHDKLPRSAIHADLFRDNVLWDGGRVGGIIDFYFACTDALLYDVAITVNDWCCMPDSTLDAHRARALIDAYHGVRPFTAGERAAWPLMLRAGALRFWVSRLYDFHLPRPGALVHAKDPAYFQHMLEQHVAHAAELAQMLV
jgi:homoserine kinase type II